MLHHHHHGFNGDHFSSCSPTNKIHSKRAHTGDRELNFWGGRKSIYVESFSNHIFNGDLEFQAQGQMDQDGLGVCSPQLWKANTSADINCESSAYFEISECRRELMNMINNMPESCYELSLEDIVDAKHGLQEVTEMTVTQDGSFHLDNGAQVKQYKKKKINFKNGQLTSIGRMENETFLIKSFFPTSLGSNKKAKAVNHSKVSGMNKNIFRKSMSSSTSSTNGSTIRCSENNFIPGCWSFHHSKKNSKTGQRGCIF